MLVENRTQKFTLTGYLTGYVQTGFATSGLATPGFDTTGIVERRFEYEPNISHTCPWEVKRTLQTGG